jgi:hypothetical protein
LATLDIVAVLPKVVQDQQQTIEAQHPRWDNLEAVYLSDFQSARWLIGHFFIRHRKGQMNQQIKSLFLGAGYALLCLLSSDLWSATNGNLSQILAQIEKLEGGNEPKCYATASRLEDFMFGTPLSDNARFHKNNLQKQWIVAVWTRASLLAEKQTQSAVTPAQLTQAIDDIFNYQVDAKGHWQVTYTSGNALQIHKDDKRQYASIAYSLRTLLAVQQESLLDLSADKLPLSSEAVSHLSDALDLYTLSVLKIADQQARINNKFEISKSELSSVWQALQGQTNKNPAQSTRPTASTSVITNKAIELKLLKSIIEQKVRSYAAYNQISNQLFVRNLQVYFARNRWPADDKTATEFRRLFTETVIAFAADFYAGAQKIALKNGNPVITEADVSQFAQRFMPHSINEYEDAIFFPKLARDQQVTIESYDMDAFRDSGIHWRYLEFAALDTSFQAYLEPDPFAVELLVENIAQFGVLMLRMTGQVGRALGDKRIALSHFEKAFELIQSRVQKHGQIKTIVKNDNSTTLKSSPGAGVNKTDKPNPTQQSLLFTNVTAESGINFMHRSSDWLNRLLRSYIKTGDDTGTITIPPAFGGSGVAAQDINNDGLPDLLILSGLGNRLYVNRGSQNYEDITKSAGLNWTRKSDKQPGEPRQPLIADLNNDGLQDIVITYVNDTHRVYRNLGNEKFADVTDQSNLGGIGLVGGPATVFDFDNDGLLDIYITYFGDYLNGVLPTLKRRNSNGLANRLFRNKGGFKFEDVTPGSNLDHTGWGQAVTHTDFDSDGLQDLIVGNDFGINAYFKNLGKGKFENVAKSLGADKPSYTMGIGIADLNDDFVPDIYISNIVTMNKDEKYVSPTAQTTMKFNPDKLAKMRVIEANDLFLSNKDTNNTVSYRPSQLVGRGYSSTGWSWDADFFDYDNDGDDDLYVLNGMNEFNVYGNDNSYYTDPIENKPVNVYIPVATKESNVFFSNEDGRLNNVSAQSGTDLVGNSRSAAYLDIDNDGDLDIVLNNYHEKAVVYRNNSERLNHHWLKVKLIGAPKQGVNLDAIGAQIIVTTADEGHIWREIKGSTGYMSVHPKVQHFGLSQHTKADIKIKWPNGKHSTLTDVKADQTLVIDYAQQKLTKAVF